MSTTLESLQSTLAAEHAAVWIYGVLGGQTSQAGQPDLYGRLTAAYTRHRARRDELIRAIRDLGVEPAASEVGYELSGPLGSPARVTAIALGLEESLAEHYADLVANTHADQRRWATSALTDAAVRGLGFRGSPEIFPGLAEFADR